MLARYHYRLLTVDSKYIDSHVKPFRCKNETCNDVEFSSTACLLRHEREAHGLHGHGNRPYLCEIKDCERSAEGNGFPRHYNLLDHMRRVHGRAKDSRSSSVVPHAANGSDMDGKKVNKARKRKTPARASGSRSEDRRKQTIEPSTSRRQLMKAEPGQSGQRRDQRHLASEWDTRRNLLQQKLQHMQGPQDRLTLEQIERDYAQFQHLTQRMGH